MDTPTHNYVGQSIRIEDGLRILLDLLEQEREALLKGNASRVSEISEDKLKISHLLENISVQTAKEAPVLTSDVAKLAKQVGEHAKSNHLLLEQMNQQYQGWLEFFMKISGQTPTYGPQGTISAASRIPARKRREIIA